ncbi:MAG: Sensor histidine kinase RcsC [Gemmatimonadaceae bacterium]|nr:Sensor histidine kinase RcsC [Gemmatimonadaceae bacterium]
MGAAVAGAVGGAWLVRRTTTEPIPEPQGAASALPSHGRDAPPAIAAVASQVSFAEGLVERATLGAFRATRDGRFVAVNPALVALLGYGSAESLLSLNLVQDVLWDDDERRRWRSDLHSERLVDWKEWSWRRRDGVRLRLRVSAWVVPSESAFFEGLVVDVSQQVRRDEILRRSERMASLGRTLAGVAHEINNPLAAIIGFAQILLKDAGSASDRQALETIVSEAQRSARIVKDLLTIARRQESTARDRVDLNEIARSTVESQRYAIESRGIRLSLVATPSPIAIRGDRAQLEQVFFNLLANARQAVEARVRPPSMGAGETSAEWCPEIVVHAQVHDDLALVEISDNGIGIAASDLPHIWDPFWTKRDEGAGSGLGLAVVHSIVTAHGGTIDAKSDGQTGTTIAFSLPLDEPLPVPADADGAVHPGDADTPAGLRPLDILVIDDESSLRDLLERLFSNRGHAVVTAADGHQAIRLAERSTFDVVVCDLRMPGMDGLDVISSLGKLPNCARARFVVSTGDTSTGHEPFEVSETPIDAFVAKPFRLEELIRAVERKSS